MSWGIQLVSLDGQITGPMLDDDPVTDVWLASYEPEEFGGRGAATWTADRKLALRFDSPAAAIECYQQVPANRPFRSDGQPNRPLTAFTVCVSEI